MHVIRVNKIQQPGPLYVYLLYIFCSDRRLESVVRSGLDITRQLNTIKLRETEKLLNRSGQDRTG